MSIQDTQLSSRSSSLELEDRSDPPRSADGQSARQVANISGEPSIERAREAFERSNLGRELSSSSGKQANEGERTDEKGSKSESTGAGVGRQRFSGRVSGSRKIGLLWLSGIGLGAALMYIFDPERGRNRRALLRDKMADATNQAGDVIEKSSRHLRNRAQGVIHEAGSILGGQGKTGPEQGQDRKVEVADNSQPRSPNINTINATSESVNDSGVALTELSLEERESLQEAVTPQMAENLNDLVHEKKTEEGSTP